MPETLGAPLSARELPALFARVHDALQARQGVIDALNVFPVPDGDTGSNMTATVRAGLEALETALDGVDRSDAAALSRAVIRGAVGGARGNSGVILSQVLRAVVEQVMGHARIDAGVYADALAHARELAYDAVAEPVEGTILTAIAVAAEAARRAADTGADLATCSAATCAATADAVARTPDQLAVLREAGVVDAGARGFEVLLAAVHGHVTGEEAEVVVDARPTVRTRPDTACHATSHQPFEVQYLLDADDGLAPTVREGLAAFGDSIVVVAAGHLLNVHVHTAQVGPVIELGLGHGPIRGIEVTHLGDQVAAHAAASRHRVGAVAVLHGDGLTTLARQLGAVVVDGMAGALPSVADLQTAITGAGADRVLLLPGHPNALAAARKAAELSADELPEAPIVVETATTPPAVLAALAVLEPDGEPALVAADVERAASAVRSAEIVDAIRGADTPVGRIVAGQPLAIVGGRVIAACDTPIAALEVIADALGFDQAELITVLHGAASSAEDRAQMVAFIDARSDAEVEVVDAGVRPARLWVGVE
jgi:uncharacterized protein